MPRPRYHTALSIALAGLVVARTHRWRDAVPILVAGILVDIDHLVDLLVNRASGTPAWIILPLHGAMTEAEVDIVVGALREAVARLTAGAAA